MASNKAEDWLDDLETVGAYAAEKIGDTIKDMPITKAATGFASNPTAQEFGAQVGNLASATSKSLQEAYGGDPVDMALNYGPGAIGGTIIGKGAKGWAKAEGKFSSMFDRMERAEISDVGSKIKDIEFPLGTPNKPAPKIKLSDIYEGPILKEYPELADMPVTIDTDLKYDGYYSEGKGLANRGITIKGDFIMGKDIPGTKGWETEPAKMRVNKDKLKTLLHEIQHAIQEKEGFARGGSPEAASSGARALMKQRNSRLNEIAFTQHNQPFPSLDATAQDNVMGLFLKENPEIARQVESIQGVNSFDLYKRLGGEIEARSVAARSNIPQEQLKYSQPYAGENIPLKEWIKAEDFLDQ